MNKDIRTVTIGEAMKQLSNLIDQAAKGEPFMIARRGKSLVKVSAVEVSNPAKVRRLGFMKGQITIPEDFDRMRLDFE
jgi:antitoxin (DNA-binding transcriptional repressor) of toxin-antitoxin stability system